jgi:transcriptional regulator with XRE-family HTH domain
MATNENAAIGSNIKKIRERLGYTQDDLANYLKVQRPVISYIENGDRDCNFDHLEKLAALFNVDLSDLLEENAELQMLNYAFAFKTSQLTPVDLESIADFQLVVKNYMKMKNLADEQV